MRLLQCKYIYQLIALNIYIRITLCWAVNVMMRWGVDIPAGDTEARRKRCVSPPPDTQEAFFVSTIGCKLKVMMRLSSLVGR